MPAVRKIGVVNTTQEKLKNAQSVVFAKYTGMNVASQQKLRRQITAAGGEIAIVRNRLMNIALGKPEGLTEMLQDQLLTVLSYADPVAPVKALMQFIEEANLPEVKGGFFENRVLSAKEVDQLSKIPSKPEMIATLLRTLNNPAQGLRNVLAASSQNLVLVLNALKEKKGQE